MSLKKDLSIDFLDISEVQSIRLFSRSKDVKFYGL